MTFKQALRVSRRRVMWVLPAASNSAVCIDHVSRRQIEDAVDGNLDVYDDPDYALWHYNPTTRELNIHWAT